MNIIGHQRIITFLNRSIEKNAVSHAYLFSGPKNLGKFTMALDFAKKITGGPKKKIYPHTKNSSEYNFGVGANPDIIIIAPEVEEKNGAIREKEIKIEKIRELEHQISLSAYYGKYKVAIIDNAEKLTVSAQNSLLKILEEPAENCVIILICHNEGKILPTVKSRCLKKRFSPVKEEKIEELVEKEEFKKEIIFWSLNRPGMAINLQKDGEILKKRIEAKSFLEDILGSNLNDKFVLADSLNKNKPELIERLNLWVVVLRRNILGENIFLKITPEKALDLIEEIAKSINLLEETNSNSKTVLENLFLKF